MNQERIWNILIENELYRQIKVAKNNDEKEFFIERYSKDTGIPVDFIREKIKRIQNQEKQNKQKEEKER